MSDRRPLRIEPVANTEGVTGAVVFRDGQAPPPRPALRVRREAENGDLTRLGWQGVSAGVLAVRAEQRDGELWVYFSSAVSYHIERGTPVQISLIGTALTGRVQWPLIPRGQRPVGEEPEPLPPPAPVPVQRPEPAPAAPAEPFEEQTIILPRVPPRVEPPAAPVAAVPQPVQPPPAGPRRGFWPILVILLLIIAAAAGYWLWGQGTEQAPDTAPVPPPVPELRREETPPAPAPPPVAAPSPPPVPAPVPAPPGPAADPCFAAETMVQPQLCPRERLEALPPAEQLRLLGLLRGVAAPAARSLAFSLLLRAAESGYPPAMMELARLYDPTGFQPDLGVRNANAARALELYQRAAAAGQAGGAAARDALVARLRQQAQGAGTEALEARTVLRQAGLE